MVADGDLVARAVAVDDDALRRQNPWAWRGPMHYGQGYGG
jgi:hypothetical protein